MTQEPVDYTPENPVEASPIMPGEDLSAGLDITSGTVPPSPESVVTVPTSIIAEPAQISWKEELKEIVTLTEDELERIYQWAKSKL